MAWSNAIDTCGRIALAVGGWFKKWWKWVAAGAAVFIAFLLGILTRPKPPAEDPVKKARQDAEDEAKAREDEIRRTAAEREKEVVVHADQERKDNVVEVKTDTNLVKDDLQKTNDYLKGVGDEMRKP